MRLRELDYSGNFHKPIFLYKTYVGLTKQVTFEFIFVFAFDTRCFVSLFLTEIRLAEVVEDIFVGAHLIADFGLALLA